MKVLIPHPFVSAGLSLAGGGYRLSAFRGGVGIELENRSFFAIATAAYDNDRMTNDANQSNPKVDDRYLDGGVYFRSPWQLPRGTFLVRAGWQWNQLSTTNYTKTANPRNSAPHMTYSIASAYIAVTTSHHCESQ